NFVWRPIMQLEKSYHHAFVSNRIQFVQLRLMTYGIALSLLVKAIGTQPEYRVIPRPCSDRGAKIVVFPIASRSYPGPPLSLIGIIRPGLRRSIASLIGGIGIIRGVIEPGLRRSPVRSHGKNPFAAEWIVKKGVVVIGSSCLPPQSPM